MTPPPVSRLVALTVCLALVAAFAVGVLTQPTPTHRSCNVLAGLVLDGGRVTTTAPLSSAGRPVAPIPCRAVGDPETTTTEETCGG